VDKLMDPVVMLDGAIMKHIQENFTTTEKDIVSLFPDMTNENLNRWESEKSASGQIIIHPYNNIKYLIDPVQFVNKYEMFTKSIIYNDDTHEMNESQRDNKIFTADMLTEAGNRIVEKEPNAVRLFGSPENVQKLKQLINEYLDFKKTLIALRNANKNNAEAPSGSSFLARIANSIIMLFTRKEKNYAMNPEKKAGAKSKKPKPEYQLKQEIYIKKFQ
jgi:hypothetical protein